MPQVRLDTSPGDPRLNPAGDFDTISSGEPCDKTQLF